MPKSRRSYRRLFAAAVGLVAISACGGSSTSSTAPGAATGPPYVIGGDQDQSQSLAYIGNGLAAGATAYFTYINTHGGINGHPVQYIPLDDRSDSATGIANLKQLSASNQAIGVMGFPSSNLAQASVPELAKDQMVGIIQGTSPAVITGQWSFAGSAYIANEATPMADIAAQLLPGNSRPKVAIINQVSAVLSVWHTNMLQVISSRSWTLTSDQSVTLAATDVTSQVTAIVNSKPDIVFSTMSGPKIVLAVQGLRKLGYSGPIVSHTPSADQPSLKSLADPNFIVLREYAFSEDSGSDVATMNAAISASGTDPNTAWVINGYVQAYITAAALKKCGWPCSSTQLLSAFNGLTVTSGLTFAPVVYTSSNHGGITALKAYKWDATSAKPMALPGSVAYGQSP